MKNARLILYCFAFALICGCRTNLYLNFKNGTSQKISVQSGDTRKTVEVEPMKFKKFLHNSGNIVVERSDGSVINFDKVRVASSDLPSTFNKRSPNLVVPHIELSIVYTNEQLFVLPPGQKDLDVNTIQPTGYPKSGSRQK